MVRDGQVSLIECKSGTQFGWNDIKTMVRGIPTQYPITARGILCLTEKMYPIGEGVYAFPITSI